MTLPLLRRLAGSAWRQRRRAIGMVAALALTTASPGALAQATARLCDAAQAAPERPGPACLLAHRQLGNVAGAAVYWSLYAYPDLVTAQRENHPGAPLVTAFGQAWHFMVGPVAARPLNRRHIADVGPIPVTPHTVYAAEFLQSTFSPGMTAPVHTHSGPEAFYAVSGDTCLETPDGAQVVRGPGTSIVVPGGPPMLLMAIGSGWRRGFALILHDAALPPTTLVHDWTPNNLCPRD